MADRKFISEVILDLEDGFSADDSMLPPAAERTKHGLHYKKQRPDVAVTQDYLNSLILLKSDESLLKYLGQITYATTDQVSRMYYAMHKNRLTDARHRLTKLWEWHVLDRTPCFSIEKYGIAPQLVYSLGEVGYLSLSDAEAEGVKRRKRSGTSLIPHQIMLGELLIGLMATTRKKGWHLKIRGERATAVQFEYNERRIRMRPDGLLFVSSEEEDIDTPLFVELDTSMGDINDFQGKVIQYNSYFASNKWKARLKLFPYVAVVVLGSALDDAAKRNSLADARIQRISTLIKGEGLWTQNYNWLFARLDRAQLGHFYMLTAKSPVLVKKNLFDVD
jgi:hypothetical protein